MECGVFEHKRATVDWSQTMIADESTHGERGDCRVPGPHGRVCCRCCERALRSAARPAGAPCAQVPQERALCVCGELAYRDAEPRARGHAGQEAALQRRAGH
eukprot:Amastigsp_a680082_10.p5 type:complete len:102 gc:universal Amastigsp_a680082_10:608-303(-)